MEPQIGRVVEVGRHQEKPGKRDPLSRYTHRANRFRRDQRATRSIPTGEEPISGDVRVVRPQIDKRIGSSRNAAHTEDLDTVDLVAIDIAK
jgi:hypothetical protein